MSVVMPCSLRARVFIVALCLVSFTVVFDSLPVGELSGRFTSCILRYTSIDLPYHGAPTETEDYTSVLLRAILDAPHSREWIVKAVLRWLTFCQWVIVGVIALRCRHIEQPNLGLFTIGIAQYLSCSVATVLHATRARVASLIPSTFTSTPTTPESRVTRVVPPQLLVTVSSVGLQLSPMRERRFRGHSRSPSRVAEIAF